MAVIALFFERCSPDLAIDSAFWNAKLSAIESLKRHSPTYYYHADHIGNSTLITDYLGREYERLNFTPHGEVWQEDSLDSLDKVQLLFTGKQVDAETGWYNFGARYLDPKTGIWLSSDPALGEYIPRAPLTKENKEANGKLPGHGGIYNPVNFALYHFAGNNPVWYTDPDGRANIIDGDSGAIVTDRAKPNAEPQPKQNNIPDVGALSKKLGYDSSTKVPSSTGDVTIQHNQGGLVTTEGNAFVGVTSTIIDSSQSNDTGNLLLDGLIKIGADSKQTGGEGLAYVGMRDNEVGAALSAKAVGLEGSLSLTVAGWGIQGSLGVDLGGAGVGGSISSGSISLEGILLVGGEFRLKILTPR